MTIPDPGPVPDLRVTPESEPAVVFDAVHVDLASRDRTYATPDRVLASLSFTAPAGRITALIGANGAGKSTAIAALSGAIGVRAGRITVLGRDMSDADAPLPDAAAVVGDEPGLPTTLRIPALLRAVAAGKPRMDAALAWQMIDREGISISATLGSLSRGQVAVLQRAIALAADPDLLVLDEPAARLDPLGREVLADELRAFMAGRDTRSVLMATHDLDGIERLADHLVVIADGRCVLEEDLDALAEVHGGDVTATVTRALADARGGR